MGIEIFNEEQYRELQPLGEFDLKTACWAQTPANIKNWVAPFFVIVAIIKYLCIIMGWNITMLQEPFEFFKTYNLVSVHNISAVMPLF
jgi:hypothetical protein